MTDNKNSTAPKLVDPAAAPVQIDNDVSMPTTRRRSASGIYPLDSLEVGQSFHVASTGPTDDPVGRLSSTVSAAKTRYSPVVTGEDGKPKMEAYERTEYKRGANGKGFAHDAEGKRIVAAVHPGTRAVRGPASRTFKVVKVGATDPRGPGARCFRVS